MPEIKAGDVVVLISGGPKMTVEKETLGGEAVDVDWFADGAFPARNH